MPTSDNSSDEPEKSMCESDAYDVSVTEHTPPLPTGEGPGVGLCGLSSILTNTGDILRFVVFRAT